jgi:hypothetical protein
MGCSYPSIEIMMLKLAAIGRQLVNESGQNLKKRDGSQLASIPSFFEAG